MFEQLPSFEMLAIDGWQAAFPLKLQADTRDPRMVIVSARETDHSAASLQCSVPSYGRTSDGISIPAVTGITAGTRYDVTILIVGVK